MQKIIAHLTSKQNFMAYFRFLQIVLDRKLTDEQRNRFPSTNYEASPELQPRIVVVLKNDQRYPNNNGGRLNPSLTDYMREHFLLIDQQVRVEDVAIQEQEAEDAEGEVIA